MKARAYGKINLNLYITEKREKMHALSSVMASISVYDQIELFYDSKISVSFSKQDNYKYDLKTIPENNTALKALLLVKELSGMTFGVKIKKGIPMAGGLGGSSADAAAILHLAGLLVNRDFSKEAIKIGSDVPFMMVGGFCKVDGEGERLQKLSYRNFDVAIIDCGDVSTKEAYSQFDKLCSISTHNSEQLIDALNNGENIDKYVYNDLFIPAISINPKIEKVIDELTMNGFNAHMSGSGGCVFVLNPNEALLNYLDNKKIAYFKASTKSKGIELIEE